MGAVVLYRTQRMSEKLCKFLNLKRCGSFLTASYALSSSVCICGKIRIIRFDQERKSRCDGRRGTVVS